MATHALSIRVALSLLLCGGGAEIASAQGALVPWDGVGDSLERIYGWPNTLYHVSATLSTPPLVFTADRPVQDYFQEEDPLGNAFGDVSLIAGGVAPVALPAAIYLGGLGGGDGELQTAGAALIQAEVIQALVVSSLKWLTDRTGPYPDGDPTARRWNSSVLRDSDDPADFNFNPFDLSGGLRWPSGHTAANMTLVSTLVAFYPRQRWLPFVGYPLVAAVGVGMIEGDYHWLSDIVAGALIGHVIGWEVGSAFRERYDAQRRSEEAEDEGADADGPAPPAPPPSPVLTLGVGGSEQTRTLVLRGIF